MKVTLLLAAATLLLGGCGGSVDYESSGPNRPEIARPAVGPVVAAIRVSETAFELHDEGDGCVALNVTHPGLQTTVERRCFAGDQVVDVNSTCGWLATPSEESGPGCEVELPRVLYGQVTDLAIGFVCIGTIEDGGGEAGVTGARFLDVSPDGFILDEAGSDEGPAAHLFTPAGNRFGAPPLDAPSDPIYRYCEQQAPWGEAGAEYGLDLVVDLADSLRNDGVTVFFHSGLDSVGVRGGAFEGDEPTYLPTRVAASSSVLGVVVETDEGPIHVADYPWPDDVLAIIGSGVECPGLITVSVSIGLGVLEDADDAIQLRLVSSECSP